MNVVVVAHGRIEQGKRIARGTGRRRIELSKDGGVRIHHGFGIPPGELSELHRAGAKVDALDRQPMRLLDEAAYQSVVLGLGFHRS